MDAGAVEHRAAGASLDQATHTVSAYPGCGEAVVQMCGPARDDAAAAADELHALFRQGPGFSRHSPRGAGDRQRSERVAVQRARTMMRRWAVQNKVDRGLTLTTAPEHHVYEMREAWAMVEGFRRRLREVGKDCVLLVPERCADGQIHFHGLVPGYVKHADLLAAWGYGFVWISKPRNLPRGTSARTRSRVIAGYLSKYLGKDLSRAVPAGDPQGTAAGTGGKGASPTGFNGKRYSTSRGTAVRKVSTRCTSMYHAYESMTRLLKCDSVHMVWTSAEMDDWEGPPTSIWLEGG